MNGPNADDEAWTRGLTLYATGDHWHAHEAWEALWLRRKDSSEGAFLRAAIQVAAAMVKAEQGNMAGVRKNLGKARANLAGAPARCRGIDTRALAADCDRCCDHHVQRNPGSFDWRFKPKIEAPVQRIPASCGTAGTRRSSAPPIANRATRLSTPVLVSPVSCANTPTSSGPRMAANFPKML